MIAFARAQEAGKFEKVFMRLGIHYSSQLFLLSSIKKKNASRTTTASTSPISLQE